MAPGLTQAGHGVGQAGATMVITCESSMKIGYLRAGFTPDPLRERFGDYVDMFRALFQRHAPHLELHVFEVQQGAFPDRPEAMAGYLCSGSAASVYDNAPWIAGLAAFAREVAGQRLPLVGVCFGHQLIAHALGGRVERSSRGWGLGVRTVGVTKDKPWMSPPCHAYNLLYSHQDQVVALPPGGELLGGNDHCPCALLTVEDRFLGFQGHPEFTPDFARALMESRSHRIAPELLASAMLSLDQPTDQGVIAAWIDHFLHQGRPPVAGVRATGS